MESAVSSPQQETKSFTENPLLSRETLRRMHSYMVQCRHYANGNGSELEAIEIPICVHLRPGDTIATIGNHWLAASLKANPLANMMADLFPDQQPSAPHVIANSAAISTQLGVSTGVAFAYKMQAQASVVILLAGRDLLDKASETLSLAGEKKLPIIFFIESRLEKPLPPSRLQKLEDEINVLAATAGFPTIPVDGRDAVAVYRVAQEAIARARKGGGPTLIECKMLPGTMDPILHIERYMQKRGI